MEGRTAEPTDFYVPRYKGEKIRVWTGGIFAGRDSRWQDGTYLGKETPMIDIRTHQPATCIYYHVKIEGTSVPVLVTAGEIRRAEVGQNATLSTDQRRGVALKPDSKTPEVKKPDAEKPEARGDFDPSMHLLPLAPDTNMPVISGEDAKGKATLIAVTTDGRISQFPSDPKVFPRMIHDRIRERFPGGKDTSGNKIAQYVAVGVMYGEPGKEAAFVFEVWGWKEGFGELDYLYSALYSLLGTRVGDEHWKAVERELSGEPVRKWINALIEFLKKELDWPHFVAKNLDNAIPHMK